MRQAEQMRLSRLVAVPALGSKVTSGQVGHDKARRPGLGLLHTPASSATTAARLPTPAARARPFSSLPTPSPGARCLPPDYMLVLPLAEAGTLRHALHERGWRPSWTQLLGLARQVGARRDGGGERVALNGLLIRCGRAMGSC